MQFLPERHYPNAPITEAVVDLVVQPDAKASLERLRLCCDHEYRSPQPIIHNQVEVSAASATTKQETLGWRFRSEDDLYVCQARLDGFGVSRLAPYEDWSTFVREARRLWKRYSEIVGPLRVQRLGVRYINRIEIPLPLNDFGEYLLTAPLVSPHLPQGLSNYVMSLNIPIEGAVTATVTEAILGSNTLPNKVTTAFQDKSNTVSILLDIDISQSEHLPLEESDIWTRLEHLRRVKNHVFESSITDKTRELFQ